VATRQLDVAGGEQSGQPRLRPDALYRYQRELEPPELEEGFATVEQIAFARRTPADYTGRALVCWLDGVLRRSRSGARAPIAPDDVEVLPGRADVLARYRDEGFTLAGIAWHPEVAAGTATAEAIEATLARAAELLGGAIDLRYCPHGPGPPRCWCRKPLPGLGVELIARHRLDPARSLYVGRDATDRNFAAALGFTFVDSSELFPTDA